MRVSQFVIAYSCLNSFMITMIMLILINHLFLSLCTGLCIYLLCNKYGMDQQSRPYQIDNHTFILPSTVIIYKCRPCLSFNFEDHIPNLFPRQLILEYNISIFTCLLYMKETTNKNKPPALICISFPCPCLFCMYTSFHGKT